MSPFSYLLLLSLCSLSLACFSCGVCSGGGCLPPPPPVCRGGCGSGYGCGQYGCYQMRARARSSKTLSIVPGLETTATHPDQRFLECCQERNLPDSCLNKCSYSFYTKTALQAMYFKQDSCPMQAAADIHFCAAQGRDHKECCVRNGVTTTLAGPKCLTFCDQRPGNVTELDLTYLSCYDRFDSMKACFWEASESKQPQTSFSFDEQEEHAPAVTRSQLKRAKTFN